MYACYGQCIQSIEEVYFSYFSFKFKGQGDWLYKWLMLSTLYLQFKSSLMYNPYTKLTDRRQGTHLWDSSIYSWKYNIKGKNQKSKVRFLKESNSSYTSKIPKLCAACQLGILIEHEKRYCFYSNCLCL